MSNFHAIGFRHFKCQKLANLHFLELISLQNIDYQFIKKFRQSLHFSFFQKKMKISLQRSRANNFGIADEILSYRLGI